MCAYVFSLFFVPWLLHSARMCSLLHMHMHTHAPFSGSTLVHTCTYIQIWEKKPFSAVLHITCMYIHTHTHTYTHLSQVPSWSVSSGMVKGSSTFSSICIAALHITYALHITWIYISHAYTYTHMYIYTHTHTFLRLLPESILWHGQRVVNILKLMHSSLEFVCSRPHKGLVWCMRPIVLGAEVCCRLLGCYEGLLGAGDPHCVELASLVLCVYMCVCIYIYIYIYICMYVCMYVYIYTIRGRKLSSVRMYVYMCVYSLAATRGFLVQVRGARRFGSVCVCVYIYVCVCVCMYVYMCVYSLAATRGFVHGIHTAWSSQVWFCVCVHVYVYMYVLYTSNKRVRYKLCVCACICVCVCIVYQKQEG